MTATPTTLDLRAQVTEVLSEKMAVAHLADSVYNEPIPFLLLAEQRLTWVRPGSWVHAVGNAYFCTPGAGIGIQPIDGMDPARTMGVFALNLHSIAPVADSDWGGPEWVGAEEMLEPHWIETTVRLMSAWCYYDVPFYDQKRATGYTADVALPQGRDGTRAVLHYHTFKEDPRELPPPFSVGDLLHIRCPLTWLPDALGKPLPVHTPVLDVWCFADMRKLANGEVD